MLTFINLPILITSSASSYDTDFLKTQIPFRSNAYFKLKDQDTEQEWISSLCILDILQPRAWLGQVGFNRGKTFLVQQLL